MSDGRDPVERLNDLLDRLARERPLPIARSEPDRGLAEAVRRFHALDDGPAASPDVVAQVWEGLMAHRTHNVSPRSPITGVVQTLSSINWRATTIPTRPNPQLRSSPRWMLAAEIAAVAAIVLTFVLGYAVHQRAASLPQSAGPALSATLGATPPGGEGAPGAAECRVAPRSPSDFARLHATPLAHPLPDRTNSDQSVPRGIVIWDDSPAGAATIDKVTATALAYAACMNTDDPRRVLALFSDEFVRREIAGSGLSPEAYAARVATPPGQQSPRVEAPDVWAVRVRPDGRVRAAVQFGDRLGTPFNVFVFVEVGDRWLIDEIENVGGLPQPWILPPTAPPNPTP